MDRVTLLAPAGFDLGYDMLQEIYYATVGIQYDVSWDLLAHFISLLDFVVALKRA